MAADKQYKDLKKNIESKFSELESLDKELRVEANEKNHNCFVVGIISSSSGSGRWPLMKVMKLKPQTRSC